MESLFHTITEKNKLSLNKASDTDVVYYSELNSWFTRNALRSFSIKFVVDQCIYYKVKNREHAVKAGNFLLASKQPDVNAYFDSKQVVKSVCIDISPVTVAEAYTILTARGDDDPDNYLAGFFKLPEFPETVCRAEESAVGQMLLELGAAISTGRAGQHVDREWFLELVEKVVLQGRANWSALNSIHSVRVGTRKEILHRLNTARDYMNEQFLNITAISEVAAFCNMSEFHFFRSFKQAFATTPYQYLLNRRLELAKDLMRKEELSITEVAVSCNFPDVFTFSKAFKRKYGITPSSYTGIYR